MSFSLTDVNRERVPENGGHELQVLGAFEVGKGYLVFVGDTGSANDYPCYSGKPDQGNIIYPWTSGILRCYTPLLPPGLTLKVTVKDATSPETHTLDDVLTVDYQFYHSTVFGIRKVLPPFYKTGPRDIELIVPLP